MLINVLRDEQPTHVAVAFDLSRQTFRSERYPSTRRTVPPRRRSSRGRWPSSVRSWTRCASPPRQGGLRGRRHHRHAVAAGGAAGLRHADRHRRPRRHAAGRRAHDGAVPPQGGLDLLRLDPALVEERYLVPPPRYPELAALVGETSDNLPGVPGVGPKTAAKWLTEYDGLENLLAHADAVRGQGRGVLPRPPGRRHAQPRAQRAGPHAGAAAGARRLRPRRLGSGGGSHPVRRAGVPRAAGAAAGDLPAQETEPEGGFEVAGVALAGGDLPGWLDEHAAGWSAFSPRAGGARQRATCRAWHLPRSMAPRPGSTSPPHAGRRRGARRLAGLGDVPQGDA
jgi:DNA polymerase-1